MDHRGPCCSLTMRPLHRCVGGDAITNEIHFFCLSSFEATYIGDLSCDTTGPDVSKVLHT